VIAAKTCSIGMNKLTNLNYDLAFNDIVWVRIRAKNSIGNGLWVTNTTEVRV